MIVWDVLRIIVVVGGIVVIVGGIRMMSKSKLPARQVLCAGLMCLMTATVGAQFEHFGESPTYRLFFNVVGVTLSGVGVWLAREEP